MLTFESFDPHCLNCERMTVASRNDTSIICYESQPKKWIEVYLVPEGVDVKV